MEQQSRNEAVESSEVCYETLEHWTRMKVQQFVQELLEEVNALLQRGKHDRRERVSPVDPPCAPWRRR
jgi:hypothetical protein